MPGAGVSKCLGDTLLLGSQIICGSWRDFWRFLVSKLLGRILSRLGNIARDGIMCIGVAGISKGSRLHSRETSLWSTKASVDYSNSDLILVVPVTRCILDANADPCKPAT